ncbi:MAG: glycosyltransferase family 4 protein [Thiogranum sp.]|nr:glycosyltransferase family 4 protein [Thiogranum sp.]
MKLKTLVLTTSFPLRRDSVSGIFVKRLVDAMATPMDVQVVTPADRSDLPCDTDDVYPIQCFRYAPRHWQVLAQGAGGIPVALRQQPLSLALVPFFMMGMLFSTLRAARHCDVIHGNWSIGGAIAGLAGRLLGRPVVTTLRGEDVSAADANRSYAALLRLSFLFSDRIVTVSRAMADELAQRYPAHRHKLVTIHNGVDDSLFQCRRPAFDSARCRVLFVGSLIPRKGAEVLIEAMNLIGQAHELQLAGAGAERLRLETTVGDLGLSGRVNFLGAIPPAEVAGLFEQADVLVLPSYSEGRPNILMEAMAAGVPVIGSDIEGISEVISEGENGLLFAAGDAEALAGRLQELISSAELQARLTAGGRACIRDNGLSWTSAAQQYHALFAELTEGRA